MKINTLIVIFFAFFPTELLAQYESMVTVEKHIRTIEIKANGTSVETEEEIDKIETQKGIDAFNQADFSYTKNMESLEILDAYTIKPNGTKVKVTKEGIREKEDSLSDGADSFSDIKHKLVIYPDVTIGSRIYSKTRLKTYKTQFKDHFFFYAVAVPYHKQNREINLIVNKPLRLNIDSSGFDGGLIKETKYKRYYKYTYIQNTTTPAEDSQVHLFDFSPYLIASSFNSYEELGAAYQNLNNPKTKVTDFIQGVADGIINKAQLSKRDEAKLIYEWVVKNIRYVAVYVGNGGIEAQDAEKVIKNGYSDCKGHAVVLEALLKARGIPSSPALINLGNAYKLPTYPVLAPQNHVINYLPDFDLYLDSTSTFTPFGMLSYGNLDKPTVLTALNKIGHTPKMSHKDNIIKTIAKMKINSDGTITGEAIIKPEGPIEVSYRQAQDSSIGRDDEEIVTETLFSYRESGTGIWKATDPRDFDVPFTETTSFTLDPISNFPGPAAMTIPVGLTEGKIYLTAHSKPLQKREFPYQCYGRTYEDDYSLEFPENTKITKIPSNIKYSKDGLSYEASYIKQGRIILIKRKLIAENEKMSCVPENEDRKKEFYKVLQQDIRNQIFYQ
jgi:hypothetical protein